MVDDLEDLRLLEAGDGLRRLIVVDEDDTLAPRLDEMIPRERADDLVVFVEDRVAAVAAFEYDLAHVVEIIGQVEGLKILPPADAGNLDGVVDHPGGLVGVERRGDDAGVCLLLAQIFGQLRLADDQAADLLLERAAGHLRLFADDDDGVRAAEQEIFIVLRQRDADLAADGVGEISVFVDDLAVKHAQEVEHRDPVDPGVGERAHVVARDLARREHAVELAVVVRDGDGGDGSVVLQRGPGTADRHGPGQGGRRVVVEIADLRAHGLDADGRLKAEAAEHQPRLIGDVSEPGRDEFPVAQRVAQRRIGHGRDDRVGIRVAVAGDIDGVHEKPPYACGNSMP